MEERGLGKPWANSNVREEWELKGTDVTQLKIRVQGFFPTLGKKVSEALRKSRYSVDLGGRGGRAPGNSGANSARHGMSDTLLGLDEAQPQTWSFDCCMTSRERALTLESESRAPNWLCPCSPSEQSSQHFPVNQIYSRLVHTTASLTQRPKKVPHGRNMAAACDQVEEGFS